MPTLLTWNYVGVHCAEAGTEEPQRLYPGDIGLDDVFGEVVIKSMTGGSLVVEYSDGDEKVTKERTVGHIRAKEGRAQQRAAPATGRPRQARGGIHNFFGAAGGEASPQAVPKKQLAPNAKGLGRTVQQPATGKAPAAKKTTAAKQPAAAKTPTAIAKAAGKRKAGADADGQEELEQEQQVNPTGAGAQGPGAQELAAAVADTPEHARGKGAPAAMVTCCGCGKQLDGRDARTKWCNQACKQKNTRLPTARGQAGGCAHSTARGCSGDDTHAHGRAGGSQWQPGGGSGDDTHTQSRAGGSRWRRCRYHASVAGRGQPFKLARRDIERRCGTYLPPRRLGPNEASP